MPNSLTIDTCDGVLTAAIAGKIDSQTVPMLQAQILGRLGDTPQAVFDVSGVSYMSSAGFRLLLLVYRTLAMKGGQCALVGLTGDIRDTMEMTGFLDFFVLHDTVEDALEQVRSHANHPCAR
jgi:anti-sigma B factor antagonist